MKLPTATYRLQFRNGMTFDRAAEVVPYLKRLGISHLYASPIFSAARGSTHGYDVIDYNEFDPALGGREGFDRLSSALQAAGLGLILDIVPNHMSASLENRWWRSVVQWGAASRYARHFDIDWSRKLTLPVLGGSFDEVLAQGELQLALDAEHGALALAYFDNLMPLHPATWAKVLDTFDNPLAAALMRAASGASPQSEDEFAAQVRRLLEDADAVAGLRKRLVSLSGEAKLLARIHDLQPWRLLHWKEARRDLSYRRFFEITGLVGVRIEDADVFADVHRLILDLVRSGRADGLRIDHVDGLADPKAYLEQLRAEVGEETYIVVEKILERDERLPPGWPISGTTGYEFIDALSRLLVDPAGAGELARAYARISGIDDPVTQRRAAKQLMVTHNFAGERSAIASRAAALANEFGVAVDQCEFDTALTELIVAFPVYRTYGAADGMPERDTVLLERVCAGIRTLADIKPEAVDLLLRILTVDVPPDHAAAAEHIRARFQQLTGPVMAKAVEDTFFFRHNAFIALNEVGGDPLRPDGPVEAFHQAMLERARLQPHGLSATATHDTKRGEDARARLYALSEAPAVWSEAVERWRGMNADAVRQLVDGPAPEPETEWMLYQALAGVWPTENADAQLGGLRDRLLGFARKAIREAKLRTSWTDINQAYEAAVQGYVERLLAPENTKFREDFTTTLDPFIRAGLINGLTQTLIKLTAPGVPDMYQGAERLDFSLTDPDNRRPVNFGALERELAAEMTMPVTAEALSNGLFKQRLVAGVLELRRKQQILFAEGEYLPLETGGAASKNVVAYARRHGGEVVVVVAPRLPLRLMAAQRCFIEAEAWGDTVVLLPSGLESRRFQDALVDCGIGPTRQLPLRALLRDVPVALLSSTPV